ncbi:GNAT family N-acetyltransferase [Microvirga tunisiensis]|uniref:GNAT family N-acetyltransferase n=2 Tax=Pannonibacter tanglangensis TaxID=2750084 RepID=A0A7X5J6P6_9HYPH|nr:MULTISPECIES: GNAT family N-acetyltransferase [unclassified Pannonibacter]NBN63221.1 GNAT family N-acetyltransferase [Pannonibacter sp. XCT-34]NBN76859.1 GNAT family N-acetyltransferase [Pannonibacter sp. XCT-53]
MTSLNLDGYTAVPAGKIAFVVTFLEMTARPVPRALPAPEGVTLVPWVKPDPETYLPLFRAVGDDWLWFSRVRMPRARLAAVLAEDTRTIHVAMADGEPVGLLELDFADPANVELAFFGLVPQATGRGLGRWLMEAGLDMAWARPQTRRFFVHTCTGDSPSALGFYRSSGFVPVSRSIEIVDDPRLLGVLPETAGAHIPLLRP